MDPIHLLIITIALGSGAFIKGVTGMGLPLISMPVLTSFLGVPHAICILVIPILVTNSWQVWHFRREHPANGLRFIWRLVAGAMAGMIIGTLALAAVEERLLVVALGLIIFVYLSLRMFRPDFMLNEDAAAQIAAPVGLAAGVFQGATGVSSPILATFVHSMRLNYGSHVFVLSGLFLMSTLTQVLALSGTGILKWEWIAEGMFALVPVAVAMPLGQRVGGHMNRAAFDKVILIFLTIIGVLLIAGW